LAPLGGLDDVEELGPGVERCLGDRHHVAGVGDGQVDRRRDDDEDAGPDRAPSK
jgi:hypothetical protein